MIRRQRLLIGMAAIGALLLILFFNLPFLIETTLKYQMARLGMSDPVVTIGQVGLHAGKITRLGFSHTINEHKVELISHDIHLHYSIAGLLTGQLDRVIVSTADIQIDKLSEPVNDVSDATNMISIPDISAIPLHSFLINKAQIFVNKEGQARVQIDASANVQKSNGGIEANLDVVQKGYPGVQANMVITQDGNIKLSVQDLDQHNILLNLQAEKLTVVNNFLNTQLKAQADFEKIVVLLHAWGFAGDLSKVKGNVDIKADVNAPLNSSMALSEWIDKTLLHASMNLDVTAQQWSGVGREMQVKIPLAVSVKEGLLTWEFKADTQLELIPDIKSYLGPQDILQDVLKANAGQKIQLTLPAGLTGQANTSDVLTQEDISTDRAIKIVYGKDTKQLQLELLLQSPSLIIHPDLQLNSKIKYQLKLPQLTRPLVRSISLKGSGFFNLTEKKANITLEKNSALSVADISHEDVTIKNVEVSLVNPAQCQLLWGTANWSCSPFSSRIILPSVTSGDVSINTKKGSVKILKLSKDQSGLNAKIHSEFSDIKTSMAAYALKFNNMQTDINIQKSILSGEMNLLSANGAVNAKVTLSHDLKSSKGAIDYQLLPVNFTNTKSLLDKIVISPQLPVQISSGVVSAKGRYAWKPAQNKAVGGLTGTLAAELSLQDINGRFKNIEFKGLASELAFSGKDEIAMKQPAHVQVALLNAGVPVTGIKFILGGNIVRNKKPVITIDNLFANAFDGTIESHKIQLNLNSNSNPFVIKFHQLNVAKLLQLEQDQGLSGTGMIDGELPFDYRSDEGLYMLQGRVYSRAPGGLLKYNANEKVKTMASSNANMKMLLDALNNFNYSKLDAGADYTPDGKLSLKVRLEGKNPEFQKGRPVHLNVNIDENILQLMRSLQLGGELGDKIGERALKH